MTDKEKQEVQEIWMFLSQMGQGLNQQFANKVVANKIIAHGLFANMEQLHAIEFQFTNAKKPEGYDEYINAILAVDKDSNSSDEDKINAIRLIVEKNKHIVDAIAELQAGLISNFVYHEIPLTEDAFTVLSYNDIKLLEAFNEQADKFTKPGRSVAIHRRSYNRIKDQWVLDGEEGSDNQD